MKFIVNDGTEIEVPVEKEQFLTPGLEAIERCYKDKRIRPHALTMSYAELEGITKSRQYRDLIRYIDVKTDDPLEVFGWIFGVKTVAVFFAFSALDASTLRTVADSLHAAARSLEKEEENVR
jgi:hypothetical protein